MRDRYAALASALILLAAWTALLLLSGCASVVPQPEPPPAPPAPALPMPRPGPKLADVLYVFIQPGCAPCRRLEAELDRTPMPFTVVRIDIRRGDALDRAVARKLHVTVTPTLIRINADGREVRRRTGFATAREISAWFLAP